MCGRMAQATVQALWRDLVWNPDLPPGFVPRYNIAPTSEVLVIRSGPGGWSTVMMRWGLVPSW